MKKSLAFFFVLALTTTLFAGCFGSDEADTPAKPAEETVVPSSTKLTEDKFVGLSAEILCLPTNNPTASPTEIEQKAKTLAAKYGVTEVDYETYQKKVEADQKEKTRLGYAIIGRMGDFCKIENKATEVKPETSPAAPTEAGVVPAPTNENGATTAPAKEPASPSTTVPTAPTPPASPAAPVAQPAQ